MFDDKAHLVRTTLEAGTGAEISLKSDKSGLQTSLQIWFSDLSRRRGPVVSLGPSGLRRHRVTLSFGAASDAVIEQIDQADDEAVKLARSLLRSVSPEILLNLPAEMTTEDWLVNDPHFSISAERRGIELVTSDDEISKTCDEIVVPMMAAMAELIGYDEVPPDFESKTFEIFEGAILLSVIKRRERNPRNRLLAIRLHGHRCGICGLDPRETYGAAGDVIEVHHLQPLAGLSEPKAYDPVSDLIPLCPNCHRVVHSRRPVPLTPAEVSEMISNEKC